MTPLCFLALSLIPLCHRRRLCLLSLHLQVVFRIFIALYVDYCYWGATKVAESALQVLVTSAMQVLSATKVAEGALQVLPAEGA
jgi:hypothetical protein